MSIVIYYEIDNLGLSDAIAGIDVFILSPPDTSGLSTRDTPTIVVSTVRKLIVSLNLIDTLTTKLLSELWSDRYCEAPNALPPKNTTPNILVVTHYYPIRTIALNPYIFPLGGESVSGRTVDGLT